MAQAAPFKPGQRVRIAEGAYAGDTGRVWKALPDFSLVRIDRRGEGMVRIRTANVAALEEQTPDKAAAQD